MHKENFTFIMHSLDTNTLMKLEVIKIICMYYGYISAAKADRNSVESLLFLFLWAQFFMMISTLYHFIC